MKERNEHLFGTYFVYLCASLKTQFVAMNSLCNPMEADNWYVSFIERETGLEWLNNQVTQVMKEQGFILRVSGSEFHAF